MSINAGPIGTFESAGRFPLPIVFSVTYNISRNGELPKGGVFIAFK